MSADTGYAVLNNVLNEHEPTGWAIEFGVYSGFSLGLIADHMPVIGLDSFEGLPEDWREGFEKGRFDMRDKPHLGLALLPPSHAMIVPGWFADTLPMLVARGLPPLGLVHVDCDLYSSTVTALAGVVDAIGPGTYVVFDEFAGYPGAENHESKAWLEFCAKHDITAEVVDSADQEWAFVIREMGERK